MNFTQQTITSNLRFARHTRRSIAYVNTLCLFTTTTHPHLTRYIYSIRTYTIIQLHSLKCSRVTTSHSTISFWYGHPRFEPENVNWLTSIRAFTASRILFITRARLACRPQMVECWAHERLMTCEIVSAAGRSSLSGLTDRRKLFLVQCRRRLLLLLRCCALNTSFGLRNLGHV